ncbi:GxxExxY protein [Lentisphaera marina]|uniref:GxxExxY protein n=1 Tax=Lentisphaera marina TaxID=1111041 RepID=UPI002366A889|nr:GxxExxY protein [Lentisphaera marina]MDD7984054.1 GxxExxY protein [Lentisphaera marina]
MDLNTLSGEIISASIFVHKNLGPGLLESVYESCLTYELRDRGFKVETQIVVPVVYRGMIFGDGFRADMLVNEEVVVELKSVENLKPVHKKQVLTYLKLMDKRLGLLINFGEVLLKDGVYRVVNQYKD